MNEHDELIAYLAKNDAPCPSCGANLRNQNEPVCPKCQKDLWLGELRAWHEVIGDAQSEPVGPTNGTIFQNMFHTLESNDFACPGCGYQLRGIRSSRCPECARRIRPSEVSAKRNIALEVGTTLGIAVVVLFIVLLILEAMHQ